MNINLAKVNWHVIIRLVVQLIFPKHGTRLRAMKYWKNTLWGILLTILGIACFPVNPFVMTGFLKVETYLPLTIIGWFVWLFGMILVMAPIALFPRRGGIPKGKSFGQTTKLVDTGIYSIIRHPQYTGGIYALFLTTFLWYPHWLFALLGVIGIMVIYLSCREEDKLLVKKFGDDYNEYRKRVPAMNFILGVIRLLRDRRKSALGKKH